MIRTLLTIAVLAVLAVTVNAPAQTGVPFNQRDDEYRLLGLKRAREAFEVARREYERAEDLFRRQLISQVELDRARSRYADAEVNYQQSLLAVLFEQQYVSILKAVKYQATDGRTHVRLTVANMSGGSAEFQHLVEVEDELFRALKPDIVHNVYVSILNGDGAIISQPYEAKIDRLRYGDPVTLDFAMLQDLDAGTVYLIYSNGTERNFKVFLEKDATVNRVLVQSEQFSQEVPLGKSASFDLTLELFSGESDTYSLEVVNLPNQIARYFTDPGGRARLSQIKFTEAARTKRASLEVSLPDRPTGEVAMDQPITFFALIIPRTQRREMEDLTARTWTEKEIQALNVGYVRLELVPRGKGELLVRAPVLFHSIDADEQVAATIDLFNEGTHRIDNIEFDVGLPLGWQKTIEPDVVRSLDIGQEVRVHLTLQPPDGVAEGKYEVRLRTTGMSDNQPVSADDKSFTIEVRGSTSIVGASLVLLLLVGVIGGVVVFAVRLAKR